MMSDSPERRNYEPQSVRKAMAILGCFGRNRSELSVAELSDQLGMRPSSLYRYLTVLTEEQYLQRVADKPRYALGPRLIELGGLALGRLDVRRLGQDELNRLAYTLGLRTNLAILHQGDVLHLAYSDPPETPRGDAVVGRRSTAHCTALGKAMLAFQPEELVRRTIQRYGWRPRTERSIQNFDRLFAELADTRARGYAIEHGELRPTGHCLAAPVRGRDGKVIAAISVSDPLHSLEGEVDERIVHEVCHRAESLSLRLGYSEWDNSSDLVPNKAPV